MKSASGSMAMAGGVGLCRNVGQQGVGGYGVTVQVGEWEGTTRLCKGKVWLCCVDAWPGRGKGFVGLGRPHASTCTTRAVMPRKRGLVVGQCGREQACWPMHRSWLLGQVWPMYGRRLGSNLGLLLVGSVWTK